MTDTMEGSVTSGHTPQGATTQTALQVVSLLHQLTMEAVLCENEQELIFRILNRTVAFSPYDRASLWSLTEGKARPCGVSGQSRLPKNSELLEQWLKMIRLLKNPGVEALLDAEAFQPGTEQPFTEYVQSAPQPSVLWMPLRFRERLIGGLWLERWEGRTWNENDLRLLKPLMLSYGAAWDKLRRQVSLRGLLRGVGRGRVIAAGLSLLFALIAVRVPLRVVAPCEVVARAPYVITAPINGVIAQIDVKPGQTVSSGQLLLHYDNKVAMEELDVARQQVRIIQSNLTRTSLQAFADTKAKAEIALLELKLEQEQARLRVAEYNASKLKLHSEIEGRVVMDDPNEWRGKPVMVGQKVLMLVDPTQTKLRAWLPADDNIPFDSSSPVVVHLNAFPEQTIEASLTYVADNITTSPEGMPAVLVEAQWKGESTKLRMGLQGSATISGNKVSLGYWLFRKPFAWFRKALGV